MDFWQDAARSTRSAVARNIILYSVYDDGAGTTYTSILRSLTADTSGTVVLAGDPESYIAIGRNQEFRMEFSQPVSDVFVDIIMLLEVS